MASVINAIAYSIFAVLILRRHRRHFIGWLYVLLGGVEWLNSVMGLVQLLLGITPEQAAAEPTLLFGLVAVIGHTSWVPAIMIPLTLVVQFFPTGRLPSRRWLPVTLISIFAMGAIFLRFFLSPYPLPEDGITFPYNPFAVPAIAPLLAALQPAALLAFAAGWIGSVTMLFFRLAQARGRERAQIKWFLYVVASLLVALLAFNATRLSSEGEPGFVLFQLTPTILAAAIAVAILRYHLFDIDLIIRRTLQYGLLSGILALVYFGLVIALQSLLSPVEGGQNSVTIVLSTLGVAALFNPLRRRTQRAIDRRFYRRKYEAATALSAFAATARDEVDMQRLTASLLGVVAENIQPTHLSLWLSAVGEERRP